MHTPVSLLSPRCRWHISLHAIDHLFHDIYTCTSNIQELLKHTGATKTQRTTETWLSLTPSMHEPDKEVPNLGENKHSKKIATNHTGAEHACAKHA